MANVAAKENGMLLSQDLRTVTIDGPPSQYMRINVGGYFFSTTIGTLTSRDTMLRAMFSGKMEVLTDAEGWILIDRCGTHFGRILNWLRDGQVPLPSSQVELEELALEAKYYLCEELLHLCETKLNASRATGSEPEAVCQVPYVTSPLEEQMLLLTTKRPVVKLQINRHNNKYSYTSASEENLLKSLELFDKMALKFCKRILFIKDVVSTNEICCWAFYGNSKKLAEVCCTSIVYTSDKGKHTKVEFPESRILEETLNVLLYERPFAQMFQPPAGSFSPADTAPPTANAATVDAGASSSANNFGSNNNNNAAGRVRHAHHSLRQTSSEQQPDVVGAVTTHHPQSNANASRSHGSCSSAHLVTASSSTRATPSSQQQVVRVSQSASGENNEAANVGRSSSHSLTRSSNPTSSGSSTN